MKKILSDKDIDLIFSLVTDEWERIDRYGKYDQLFIDNKIIQNRIESFFEKKITKKPIMKILRMNEGDGIPTFSADYSNMTDKYYSRYVNTNFIIQICLNDDYNGGIITKVKDEFIPKKGFGFIQNKAEKCRIDKITKGTAYFLFIFISKIQTNSLL